MSRRKFWKRRAWRYAKRLYDRFILRDKDDPRFVAFCRTIGLQVPGEPPGG